MLWTVRQLVGYAIVEAVAAQPTILVAIADPTRTAGLRRSCDPKVIAAAAAALALVVIAAVAETTETQVRAGATNPTGLTIVGVMDYSAKVAAPRVH